MYISNEGETKITCPECKAICGDEDDGFCPYCLAALDLIVCFACKSSYNPIVGDCPMCAITEKVIKEEKILFDNIEQLTSTEIDIITGRLIKVLYYKYTVFANGNPVLIMSFVSKYAGFIHSIWQFLINMQKGVIPNKRISEAEKIKWVEAHLEMFYAEGSLFEDALENPDTINLDKLAVKFINMPQSNIANGIKVYHALQDNDVLFYKLLRRFIYLHKITAHLFKGYVENIRDKEKMSPINKWNYILKHTIPLISKKEFEIEPK